MKALGIIALLLLSSQLAAHSPSETHTHLHYDEGKLEVTIELPWSITEVLKEENPQWNQDTPGEVILEALINYVNEHFNVIRNGEILVPNTVQDLAGDHNHSVKLKMIFPLEDPDGIEIRNTLLFNKYENQENHHVFTYKDLSRNWRSTPKYSQYVVDFDQATFQQRLIQKSEEPTYAWTYIAIGGLLLLFLMVWEKIRLNLMLVRVVFLCDS